MVPEVRTYRGRVLWGPFEPVRRRDLWRLRRATATRLPPAYERFAAVANGGRLPYAVTVPPDGRAVAFTELLTLTPNALGGYADGSVLGEWRRRSAAAPADALPVARAGDGATLLLRTAPDRFGAVEALAPGLVAVAASFDDYLGLLHVPDDLARATWADAQRHDTWRPVVERWLDAECPGWRDRPWARVSDRLAEWVRRTFPKGSGEPVLDVLRSLGPPLVAASGPGRERIQAALVLRTGGDWYEFQRMVELLHQDFRDVLMNSDLAHDDWRDRLDANL